MLIQSLFESESSDRVARLLASMTFKQIKGWLEQAAPHGYRGLKELPEGSRYAGGFFLSLNDIGSDYTDLSIIFMHEVQDKNTVMGAAFGKSADASNKFIFMSVLIAPGDTTHLSTRFAMTEKHFVHEFMHYLMVSRNKSNPIPSSRKLVNGDTTAYHNDNDETNAYYQEAAHGAVEFFKAVVRQSPEKAAEFAQMTTQELMQFIIPRFANKDFMDDLSRANRRAFLKRMVRCIGETIRPMLDRA